MWGKKSSKDNATALTVVKDPESSKPTDEDDLSEMLELRRV